MAVVRSRTRSTTFRRIANAGELGPSLIKLMMAVNDLGIANHGLQQWKESPPAGHDTRSQGAKSYFVRLMTAHTFEALKVIHKINSTPKFKKLVDQCDRQTREAFARLVKVIGTREYSTMKRIRNAIAFHYETDAITKAIERQSDKFPDHVLTLSSPRPSSNSGSTALTIRPTAVKKCICLALVPIDWKLSRRFEFVPLQESSQFCYLLCCSIFQFGVCLQLSTSELRIIRKLRARFHNMIGKTCF
jgi:hypothetical protein